MTYSNVHCMSVSLQAYPASLYHRCFGRFQHDRCNIVPRRQDFASVLELSHIMADFQQNEAMLRNKVNPLLGQYLGLPLQRVRPAGQRSSETDGSIVDAPAIPQVRSNVPLFCN